MWATLLGLITKVFQPLFLYFLGRKGGKDAVELDQLREYKETNEELTEIEKRNRDLSDSDAHDKLRGND